jgi:hypothetical protein
MIGVARLWAVETCVCIAAALPAASSVAASVLDDGPGFVCPFPDGGAWVSASSLPGCTPAANYRAAELEVTRLNRPENLTKNLAKTQSVFELLDAAK